MMQTTSPIKNEYCLQSFDIPYTKEEIDKWSPQHARSVLIHNKRYDAVCGVKP